MKYLPILETERLIIRPISMDDLDGLFEMDSQPEVHIYLKNEPIKTIDQTKKIIEDLVILLVGRVLNTSKKKIKSIIKSIF